MAPRKNAKGGGSSSSSSSSSGSSGSSSTSAGSSSSGGSSSPGARRETKHGGYKNERKGGLSGSSFFTWFMVIALLGVWTSVAVVWFELVDYEEVLGKLEVYDADGDGDFDVDDAKVLLGLKEGSPSEPAAPGEQLEPEAAGEQVYPGTEPQASEDEEKEDIQAFHHETVHTEHEDMHQEEGEPARDQQLADEDLLTGSDIDDKFKSQNLEAETFHEETVDSYHVEEPAPQDYVQDMEEVIYEQESPDSSVPVLDDERLHHDADDVMHQVYDEQVYEPSENERIEISENDVEESHIILEEVSVPPAEEQHEEPSDT